MLKLKLIHASETQVRLLLPTELTKQAQHLPSSL